MYFNTIIIAIKRQDLTHVMLQVRGELVWQEKADLQQSTLKAPSASPGHNTDVNWALILGSLSLTRRITQLSVDVVRGRGSAVHSNLAWRGEGTKTNVYRMASDEGNRK